MEDAKALVSYGWRASTEVLLFVTRSVRWKLKECGVFQAPQTGGHEGFLVLPFQRNVLKMLGKDIYFNSIGKAGGKETK